MLLNKKDDKIAFIACLLTTIAFFFTHFTLTILFFAFHVTLMAYYDIFSVCFYVVMLILVLFKKYRLFVIATYIEVIVYSCMGIISFGFGFGFEMCILGMISILFYCAYFAKRYNRTVYPLELSIGSMVLFILLFIRSALAEPIYNLDEVENASIFENALFIFHGILSFGFVITFMCLLTHTAIVLEKLYFENSIRDKLTGLLNRNGLSERYNALKDSGNYYLAMFDIDDFKLINDKYGHNCGDFVLNSLANLAVDAFPIGTIARWGGEEFILILPKTENTIEEIDNFRQKVADTTFKYKIKNIKISITIGVALNHNYSSVEEWVEIADKRLYAGKNSGKNVTIYE